MFSKIKKKKENTMYSQDIRSRHSHVSVIGVGFVVITIDIFKLRQNP